MGPSEWIYLASIILGSIDSIGGGLIGKSRLNKVKDAYKNEIDKINKDNELINQIEVAYKNRDANLIQALLTASPFGNYAKQMANQLKDLRDKEKNLSEKKVSIATEQSKINQEYNDKLQESQSTGSLIGDLISGGVDTSQSTKYTGSGFTDQDLQEVNKLW